MAEQAPGLPVTAGRLLRARGIVVAYLFGSRARGDARPGSDADVGVLLEDPARRLPLLAGEAIAASLAEALEVPAVDLRVLDRAPLELRARVVHEGRVLFSDDEARRVRFEVDTQSRWFDVRPAHEAGTRAYLQHVARAGLRG